MIVYGRSSFILRIAVALALVALPLHSEAEDDSDGSVLGRAVRLDILCDDFEDRDWHYNYQDHTCYRGFWGPADRGEPEFIRRVVTPSGGLKESSGALEIRTDNSGKDNNPGQDDLKTQGFSTRLGRDLARADQPLFVVRVWLPPFSEWPEGKGLGVFGFRQAAQLTENRTSEYYPSIWFCYDKQIGPSPYFFFRLGNGRALDVRGDAISQPGWWTLAIAFDTKGIGHYYARPGIKTPTEANKMFDTTRFRTVDGIDNRRMAFCGYSFFSLGSKQGASTRFVIDDYEVWAVKGRTLSDVQIKESDNY